MKLLGRAGELQLKQASHLQSRDSFERYSEANGEEMFREHIATYLKLVRKREDMYCRVCKLPDVKHCQMESLLEELSLLTKKIVENRHVQSAFAAIDRKTLSYHLCAKLVELLQGLKNRVSSATTEQLIENNKQEVLKKYRCMVDSSEFDAASLVQTMTGFKRKSVQVVCSVEREPGVQAKDNNEQTKTASSVETTDCSRNRFLMSTHILSGKEKQHLLEFMQGKQKLRQKKAKIEEQSKNQLKNIRHAFKSLYGPLQAEEVLKNEYCLSLTKDDNMKCLLMRQMERNSLINDRLKNYSESHKAYKTKLSRFRIRKQPQTPTHSVPVVNYQISQESRQQQS